MTKFSLIHEPWIKVRNNKGDIQEVSLLDIFAFSQEYISLAGELPAQDIAVLRLLLAIMYRVFSIVDENGKLSPLDVEFMNRKEKGRLALIRWISIWKQKSIPFEPIKAYLSKWEDRFNLYDEKFPFYQVPLEAVENASITKAARLDGTLFKSDNVGKTKILANRKFTDDLRLTDSEAARWLLFIQAFDDGSIKSPVPSVGFCGRLGLLVIRGNNIFETIMLNWPLLKDGVEPWSFNDNVKNICKLSDFPSWELSEPRTDIGLTKMDEKGKSKLEKIVVAKPSCPIPVLTHQARRICLLNDNKGVYGYKAKSGDNIESDDCHAEQMTLWRKSKTKDKLDVDKPNTSALLNGASWRSFGSITAVEGENTTAGVILWIKELQREKIFSRQMLLKFDTLAFEYGSMNSAIKIMNYSTLTFPNALLLTEKQEAYKRVVNEIEKCCGAENSMVKALKLLAIDLYRCCASFDEKDKSRRTALETEIQNMFFYRLDNLFPAWLADLNVEDNEIMLESFQKLRKETVNIVFDIARSWVEKYSMAAMIGRIGDDYNNTFIAWNKFVARLIKYEIIVRKQEADVNA